MSWRMNRFGLAERIDKVGDKLLGSGFFADGLFVVSHDDFVVGDFDDFCSGDEEFGVEEGFDEGAFDDELGDGKVVGGEGVVNDAAEATAFFSLDAEAGEIKGEVEDFADPDNVVSGYELVDGIDDHAVAGIFADGFGVEDVGHTVDKGAGEIKGNDAERLWVDDGGIDAADGAGGLHAEDGSTDERVGVD